MNDSVAGGDSIPIIPNNSFKMCPLSYEGQMRLHANHDMKNSVY